MLLVVTNCEAGLPSLPRDVCCPDEGPVGMPVDWAQLVVAGDSHTPDVKGAARWLATIIEPVPT